MRGLADAGRGSAIRQSVQLRRSRSSGARGAGRIPRRPIQAIVDAALSALSGEFGGAVLAVWGRPSIPPERLLRALLLQAFYSVRSERLLMEQLDYNLLFRWFVGSGSIGPDCLASDRVHDQPRPAAGRAAATMSGGTSMASGGATDTHASTTDAEARLCRKGAGKEPAVLHGPPVDGEPLGPGRRDAADPGHRLGRTRSRQQADRGPAGPAPDHGRCRPRL